MNAWIDRYNVLDKELQAEKTARDAVARELASLQEVHSTAIAQDHVFPREEHHHHHHHHHDGVQSEETPIGCGGCSSTSRCACLEAAIDIPDTTSQDNGMGPKRPRSPRAHTSDKRIKAEPVEEPWEMDFTHSFSKPQNLDTQPAVSPSSAVADPCGFCQDGTPCICAEMAAAENQHTQERDQADHTNTNAASTRQISQFTPPPSDGDVSLPDSSTTRPSVSCNGAGTCAQCQSDPNSTLFCKTLAATRALSESANTGCCGGAAAGQSCCQSRTLPLPHRRNLNNPNITTGQTPSSSITLSCADAYTTLSRHPNYERAISSDVGSWMPKLYASPSRCLHPPMTTQQQQYSHDPMTTKAKPKADQGHVSGRPAMEIEVANVMSVLREFDRRFGSNA